MSKVSNGAKIRLSFDASDATSAFRMSESRTLTAAADEIERKGAQMGSLLEKDAQNAAKFFNLMR